MLDLHCAPPPHQKDIGVSRKCFPSILKLRDRHDLDIARGVSLLPCDGVLLLQ